MSDAISTRLATAADIPAAGAVHVESCLDVYRGFIPDEMHATTLPENLRRIWAAETLPGRDFIVLAELDGAVVGLVTVRDRGEQPAYIDHFHVRPHLKGRGVGRALWRAAVAEMLARGMNAVYLDYAEGNDAAAGFYRAIGGEVGEAVQGDLFGIPLPARVVRWPDLAAAAR